MTMRTRGFLARRLFGATMSAAPEKADISAGSYVAMLSPG
jgi:hypothetical protein